MTVRRRSLRPSTPIILLTVMLVVGLLVLLLSPYHRQFYLRVARLLGAETRRPMSASISATAANAALVTATPHRAPLVEVEGRLRIPLAVPMPSRLPVTGVPPGWEVKEFAGESSVELVRSDLGPALRLRSERTSFALYRDLLVDPQEWPVLSWAWRVSRLPAGADVRRAATDDQAVQIYVVFPRWPSPRTNSDVIGYVWDTTAPVGTQVVSPKAPNVRIIVVASGAAGLNSWHRAKRNIALDYVSLFGRRPPRIGTIAVMIDANDTGTTAESFLTDLAFSRS